MKGTDTAVANARHADALHKTSEALNRVRTGIQSKVTMDFITGDVRIALHYLGEITGKITTDDLLENIFSNFVMESKSRILFNQASRIKIESSH